MNALAHDKPVSRPNDQWRKPASPFALAHADKASASEMMKYIYTIFKLAARPRMRSSKMVVKWFQEFTMITMPLAKYLKFQLEKFDEFENEWNFFCVNSCRKTARCNPKLFFPSVSVINRNKHERRG
jgi:hypothetical protein